MDLNVKKLHGDVLDTIELIMKKKMEFDWKTLKKSMDNVNKAITTYKHADCRSDDLKSLQALNTQIFIAIPWLSCSYLLVLCCLVDAQLDFVSSSCQLSLSTLETVMNI